MFKRYRKGDSYAYNELVKCHLPLVLYISKFYRGKGVSMEDLIQEGNIGLLKAIEHFDYTRKVPFKEYAKSWILQTITMSLNIYPYIVKLPLSQFALYRRYRVFVDKFELENGYIPSVNDIGEELCLDANIISYFYQLPDSLYNLTQFVDDMDVYECPDSAVEVFEEKDYSRYQAWNYIRVLNKHQRTIVRKFFGIGYKKAETMTIIADEMGYTRERIRQIIEKSLKIMREASLTAIIIDNNYDEQSVGVGGYGQAGAKKGRDS